jgi:hypothetical protein
MSKQYGKNGRPLRPLIIFAAALAVSAGLFSGCSPAGNAGDSLPSGKTAEDSISNGPSNGSRAAAAGAGVMEDFRRLLEQDASPSEIAAFITGKLAQVSKEEAAYMVTEFEAAQKKYQPGLDDRFTSDEAIQAGLREIYKPGLRLEDIGGIKDEALKKLLAETLESGYRVETAEGMYFPIIDYAFYEKFSSNIPEDINAYIDLMAVESGRVPAKDAALVIRWDEILDRAMRQEEFMEKYGDSVKAADVASLLDNYKSFILYGLNNTPLFGYDTGAMDENARTAYANAAEKGGGKVAALLKDYLAVLKDNGYRLTDEVDKFRNNARDTLKLY